MSSARNGHPPSAPAGGPARRAPAAPHGELRELQRLVRTLERHVAVVETDLERDLALLGDPHAMVHAEPRLRAVAALLVSLATYQRVQSAHARPSATVGASTPPAAARGPGAGTTRTNGHAVNGVALINGATAANANGAVNGHRVNGSAGPSDRELAAASARYIARDLAARQLSEFTSAEGYRLARALARLGDVEEPVERLLADANRVRLHPMPLADAVSHSPH